MAGEVPRWSKKQREWFLRRDENRCQFVDFAENGEVRRCQNTTKLHVHHIIPHRWASLRLRWSAEQINSPENGIVLCEFHHLFCIHPDVGYVARKLYHHDERSYERITRQHEALLKAGIPYWWDTWDGILKRIAQLRTRAYLKAHPEDPFPKD